MQEISIRKLFELEIQLFVFFLHKGNTDIVHVVAVQQADNGRLVDRVDDAVQQKDLVGVWEAGLVVQYKLQVGERLALLVSRRQVVADDAVEHDLVSCGRRVVFFDVPGGVCLVVGCVSHKAEKGNVAKDEQQAHDNHKQLEPF